MERDGFSTGYTIDDGITQSLLGDFLSCRQRADYILDGWRARQVKTSIRFGSLVHDLLFHWYASHSWDRLEEMITTWEQAAQSEEELLDITKAEAVFQEYPEFHKGIDAKLEWVSLEKIFDEKIGKTRYRGKIDGVCQNKGEDAYWMVEHKTTSRVSESEYTDRLAFDPQILFYFVILEKLLGKAPVGILYNVIRKPGLVFRKGDNLKSYGDRVLEHIGKDPSHYYKRFVVEIEPEIFHRFKEELKRKLKAFRGWLKSRSTYRNENACYGRWRCEFVGACSSGSMAEFVQDRELFEELKEVESASISSV